MHMNKLAVGAVIAVLSSAPFLASAKQVLPPILVTSANLNGWQTRDEYCGAGAPGNQGFVYGPSGGDPIQGVGSLFLNTQFDGNKFENISTALYDGTPLSDITSLRYGTFVSFSNTWWFAVKAPYIILTVDTDGNGTSDEQIKYSPEQNGSLSTYSWQHWDAASGLWSIVGGNGNLLTLDPYLASRPNAKIVSDASGHGGILVGIGCDPLFANLVGHVDAMTVSTNTTETLYDFEPVYGPPTSRQQCQNDGWMQFNNPQFKNMGECIQSAQKP